MSRFNYNYNPSLWLFPPANQDKEVDTEKDEFKAVLRIQYIKLMLGHSEIAHIANIFKFANLVFFAVGLLCIALLTIIYLKPGSILFSIYLALLIMSGKATPKIYSDQREPI